MTNVLLGRVLPLTYDLAIDGEEWSDYANVMGIVIDQAPGSLVDLTTFGNWTPINFRNGANIYWSSGSPADSGIQARLIGLDISGNMKTETATLTAPAQTKRQFGSDLWGRIYRAEIIGSQEASGLIWFYEDDTVVGGTPQTQSKKKSLIVNGYDRSIDGHFTTPLNKTTQIAGFTIGGPKATGMIVRLLTKPALQNNWRVVGMGSGYSNGLVTFDVPLSLISLTDVKLQGINISGTSTISSEFTAILTDD